MSVATAQAVTDLLREDETPLGLAGRESVCPTCNLVHWSAVVTPCRDCIA